MGLGKKLRVDIEKVVFSYLEEVHKTVNVNFQRTQDVVTNQGQRIDSLETEVMRLRKIVGPASLRVDTGPVVPGQDVRVEFDEALLPQFDRLARFILETFPGEPSEDDGPIDTAIRLLSDKHGPASAWSPSKLRTLMRRANDTSDKLPNEVRVRLLDVDGEDMDVSMLVVESCDGCGSGVPIISVPIIGGSINVLAPADVPTQLSLRAFGTLVRNLGIDRIGYINSVEYDAIFFDREGDKKWLPERARVEFSARHLPSHGYINIVGGILYHKLVKKYGAEAGDLCLLGQSFIEVQIITPRQDQEGQAPSTPYDPPAPPPAL
jgi:hypothetical protein